MRISDWSSDVCSSDLARDQHAVADEAVADTRDDGDLADLLGELHGGDEDVRRGFGASHDFQQLHDVGRREEVEAEHILRARGGGGDLVDVELRSEEHTSELQSLMRTSYAVFCLKQKKVYRHERYHNRHNKRNKT